MEINYVDKLTAEYVYDEIFVEEVYLQREIELKPGDIVLDVGSNIGLFSLYLSNKFPDLTIYAFEPVPQNFEVLSANLKNFGDNIKALNVGLGDKEEEMDFFFYPRVSADSTAVEVDWEYKIDKYVENYKKAICKALPIARLVPKFLRKWVVKRGLKHAYKAEKVSCKIRKLSNIIKEQGIQRIDLMKVDAENYEWPVLMGIEDGDWDKIQQIAMEVHTHIKGGRNLMQEITELFEDKGFTVEEGEESRETLMGVYMLYARKEK